jgi:hypothetical protein
MMEDEERRIARLQSGEGDSYVYDYFKFMTSLSLLTLAGIFAISQMDGALEQIGKPALVAVMAAVAGGGIVHGRGAGSASQGLGCGVFSQDRPAHESSARPFCVGVGASLMMFLDVMY